MTLRSKYQHSSKLDQWRLQDLWEWEKYTANDAQIIHATNETRFNQNRTKDGHIPTKVVYNGIYNVQKAVCCTHCYKYN